MRNPLAAAALLAAPLSVAAAQEAAKRQEPIRIGFGMGLTGGLASAGKAALLAMKIWEEETNAKGGLLGRPAKLFHYDDQSNPATVPAIYTKLLGVDRVDIVASDYGTNLIFHNVKGSDLDQWKTDAKQTILGPDKYATGKINYPDTEARKGGGAQQSGGTEGSSPK